MVAIETLFKSFEETIEMNTIGRRIRLAMTENELRQVDVLEQLRTHGIEMSKAQLSKIVNDDVTMFAPETLIALGKILDINLHYMITGEELETKVERFFSDEANAVGAMIDAMMPRSRRMILIMAESLLKTDQEQRSNELEIAALLEENIKLLSNGDRKVATDYIERTGRYR